MVLEGTRLRDLFWAQSADGEDWNLGAVSEISVSSIAVDSEDAGGTFRCKKEAGVEILNLLFSIFFVYLNFSS